MNIRDIADISVRDLAEYCDKEYFLFPIVQRVETPDDMQRVSEQMGILTGYSSFLASIMSHLKYMIRDAKNDGNKELADDLIDKKTIIENAFKSVNQSYACLSQRVAIHKDIMMELHMTDSIKK